MSERKVAVEEELLLVNQETYQLEAVSHRAIQAHRHRLARSSEPTEKTPADSLEQELFLQQLETATAPRVALEELRDDIRRCRGAAREAAATVGARVVAVGAPILAFSPLTVTRKPRYERMVHDFGEIGRQGVVCGMHVHVDVDGDDEGVAVLDRIRPWLPVLLAISANSPFWDGADTGYSSWRSQVWKRWPTAGQSEPFGDPEGYRSAVADLIVSGAAFDPGMLYFDARLAQSYPTVEIRVADVCTEVEDALLVAALARGLVATTARNWHEGAAVPTWRSDLLRAAHWRAGRDGMSHDLVDPITRRPARARDVVRTLVDFVADSLEETGDRPLVDDAVERLFAGGSGAGRQRAVHEAQGSLEAVLADLGDRTDRAALSDSGAA